MNSFEDVSVTQRLRIMGDDVRLFRCEPLQGGDAPSHLSDWLSHVLSTLWKLHNLGSASACLQGQHDRHGVVRAHALRGDMSYATYD